MPLQVVAAEPGGGPVLPALAVTPPFRSLSCREKALALTGNQGIEQAMDWLVEHENDPDVDDPYVPPQGLVLGTGEPSEGGAPPTPLEEPDPEAEGSRVCRQRVREKIERDKAERAKKFGGGSAQAPAEPVPAPAPTPVPSQEPPTKREYDQCRIQVPNVGVPCGGDSSTGGGGVGTTPIFTEEDMEKPLQELGLVPSAVLIVAKKGSS
ncbi:UBX domain-containing protein 1 [Alligator sinensis]|uniref:UBX domain-containing protein 1 n=1 Tax=Alligator sinensis TaxID=38654 RepID=A0A3Q0HJM5_ALLSI|nr:UBX domain-containing protein 1 [Alligator sinensis]